MTTHPIPNAALDDKLAFVGLGGSGKTYNAGVAVERLLEHRARICIIDPLGAWWGLRLAANGKDPSGHKVVIFGGPHADIGLTEQSGALIGETVAGMAESCIIDLSELGSDAAERRFMLAFLTALYKHQSKSLLHVIFDEADMWAPQIIFDKEGGASQLVGKMQNIVRRGRIKGFIPWLITQRPAVINWGVLSQVTGVVAFTLTSSQDRDAIGNWVKGQADKERWTEIWGRLAELPVGEGLVWVPRRKIFGIQKFPPKQTFDSSRAPKRGERRQSRKLRPLDVGALKERLATVDAEAKANDPRALHIAIAALKNEKAALERQVAAGAKKPPDKDELKKIEQRAIAQTKKSLAPLVAALEIAMKFIVQVNARGFGADDKKALEEAVAEATKQAARAIDQHLQKRDKQLEAVRAEAERIVARLKSLIEKSGEEIAIDIDVARNEPFTVGTAVPRPASSEPLQTAPRAKPGTPLTNGGDEDRPLGAERKPLAALAAVHPAGMTEAQWAVAAGLKRSGGTWSTYISRLRMAGRIIEQNNLFYASEKGLADLGQNFTPMPPPGMELVRFWTGKIAAVGPMLNSLAAIYPQWTSREDLAAVLNLAASGGTFSTYLSRLRSPGLIEEDGSKVRAAPTLMVGAA